MTNTRPEAASPFLARPESDWIASNTLAFAIFDGFPVSPGHALIIPRRLVATWFDATVDEQRALMDLVAIVKARIERDSPRPPDGWNIGINIGPAGGQTVFHLHVHLIPRFTGDMDDPRGGVRHVIPWKGNYKRLNPARIATGGGVDPFLGHLAPHFETATDIAILAAFIRDSGLDHLEAPIFSAVSRGARVRVLGGDYLDITQAAALRRLLDWQARTGFEARIHEVRDHRSFHPKSWRFDGPDAGVVFVGSSNISAMALDGGIEWNMLLSRAEDPTGYKRLVHAFDDLWRDATPLSAAYIDVYETNARAPLPAGSSLPHLPPGEVDMPQKAPEPHAIQQEALRALAELRAEGASRAIVVMATGLGKTWLAAFDIIAAASVLGGRPPSVLFVAHRDEILRQTADTLRRALRPSYPQSTIGFCAGPSDDTTSNVILASIQKVCREPWLSALAARRFDYVVIDEVHHAEADSYRRLLARLDPVFLLGLTATPERADGGDILPLFDDNLAYAAHLDRGIEDELLAPFHYFGIRDTVDYRPIPWRNHRFDPEILAHALETEARMERLLEAWRKHPGTRTLIFCASINHATHSARWLEMKGIRVATVHSGPQAMNRADAIAALRRGELDAIVSVDLFNEGVDVPEIDRVVMLRPTESPTVFLQQLGRGLRRSPGKHALTIIDFVGNHRVFIDRLALLVAPGRNAPASALKAWLLGGTLALPTGCSVDIELAAIDVLMALFPNGRSRLELAYREHKVLLDRRPDAAEMHRAGVDLIAARRDGGWFAFVAAEGDLSENETAVRRMLGPFLLELESTTMSKCFKMVVIDVLLAHDAFFDGMPLDRLAERSLAWLQRSPGLRRDLDGVKAIGDSMTVTKTKWLAYWKENPVRAWTGGPWFRVVTGTAAQPELFRFVGDATIPEPLRDTFVAMVREIVALRLSQYRARPRMAAVVDLATYRRLRHFPTLQAAAGQLAAAEPPGDDDSSFIDIPLPNDPGADAFVVTATGDSMNGGPNPIHDGDRVVMRPLRGVGAAAVNNKVVLVQCPDPSGPESAYTFQLKRVRRSGNHWRFASDNPAGPVFDVTPSHEIIALVVAIARPDRE